MPDTELGQRTSPEYAAALRRERAAWPMSTVIADVKCKRCLTRFERAARENAKP